MAHSFGSTVLARSSAATSPITRSATTSAGDTVLVLMLNVQSATSRAGGAPTFNGVDGIQANSTQKAAASPEASAELWYWTGAVTSGTGSLFIGTANIVIPNTGSLTIFSSAYTGQAGAGKTSAFDAANGTNATSTNPTTNAIVGTVNGDIYFATTAGGWQTFAPSGRAGTSLYETDDGATGGGGQYLLQATAGSQAMTWTFGTSDDWGAVGAAFKEVDPPVAPSPGTGGLSFAGTVSTMAFRIGLSIGALAFAGQAPALQIDGPGRINVPVGTLRFQGPARPVTNIQTGAGALSLVGRAPSLDTTYAIGSATLGFTGRIPTLSVGSGGGPAVLTLAGLQPTIARGVPIGVGTLTFAGQAPTVGSAFTSSPAVGTLTLTGLAPSIAAGQSIPIPAGSLVFKGPARATATSISVSVGSLAFTGLAPALSVAGGATSIPIGAGALTLTGQAPLLARTLPVGVGSLTLAGLTPQTLGTGSVAPGVGTLTITGRAPSLKETRPIPVGTLTLAGQAPVRATGQSIAIPVGTLTLDGKYLGQMFDWGLPANLVLTGYAPTLSITGQTNIAIGAGAFSLTGRAPSLGTSVAIGKATLTLTGQVPSLGGSTTIAVAQGSLSLSGLNPQLLGTGSVSPQTGVLALTGTASTLAFGVAVPQGVLTFAGQVPVAAQGRAIAEPAGTLALTGLAPSLQLTVAVGTGSLSLTGQIPSTGGTVTAAIPVGTLALVGQAPIATRATIPAVGTLTLTGQAPSLGFVFAIPAGSLSLTGSDMSLNPSGAELFITIRALTDLDLTVEALTDLDITIEALEE